MLRVSVLRLALLVSVAAPAVAAQTPLGAVADALGGRERIDALTTLVTQSRIRAPLGNRRVRVASVWSVRLPDAARWDVGRGAAARSVALVGDTLRAIGGGALGAEAAAHARQSLWLDPVVLAARRREVLAQRLGPDLLRLTVPGFPEAVLLRLDADRRPEALSTFRRRDGRREYLEVRYSDYRVVDGIAIPHRVAQAAAGVETGVTAVQSVRLGQPLEDAAFR